MSKKKAAAKKMRFTFETKESGLARQVSKALKTLTKPPKRRPSKGTKAGGWSQSGGWLLDNGPTGPWGLQGGWTQGSDRPKRRPGRGSKINPTRKNVRRALKKAKARK